MVMIRQEAAAISAEELRAQFRGDVLQGLQDDPKHIPSKYFYDARGSKLFEQICRSEEYYLTRTEFSILQRHIREIGEFAGAGALLIEPGSGSAQKIELLLRHIAEPAGLIAIDIDQTALQISAQVLGRTFPQPPIHPIWADFTQLDTLGEIASGHQSRVVFFPGSTIGNFEPGEAVELLGRFNAWTHPGGRLILGLDLEKDPVVVKRAYNDSAGLTSEFNLNLLARINSELGADFDLSRFCHVAPYRRRHKRVEMHLISLDDQVVTIGDVQIPFRAGETIHTENSYKHRLVDFCHMAADAGWRLERLWTDEQAWFAVLGFCASEHRRPPRLAPPKGSR